MKKTLILASVSLLCLSSVFSSDRTDRAQFGVPSQGITPSAGVEPHDNIAQPPNNPSAQSSLARPSPNSLKDMPSEILGIIANNLEAEDVVRLQNMTRNKTLQALTHTPTFYQQNSRVMTFDVGNPKGLQSLIKYLQEAPQDANINLSLSGVTLDNLKQILPYCNEVKALDLGGGYIIGDKEVEVLAESPYLVKLTALNLSSNNIGTAGAKALANSKTLIKLTFLNLASNNIGTAGVEFLANSENLASLTALNLANNKIGDKGAIALANSKTLINLTFLSLARTQLNAAGAIALAGSKNLANLTSLCLLINKIGDEGAIALAESPYLINLTSLELWTNNISDKGAKALAESKNLASLTSLELRHNKIGDEGAIALANSKTLINLASLDLSNNNIGTATKEALKIKHPFVRI